MKRLFDSETAWKVYSVLLVLLVLAVIVGLVLWIRHSAPCWMFPLAEAPSRCLVVNPR